MTAVPAYMTTDIEEPRVTPMNFSKRRLRRLFVFLALLFAAPNSWAEYDKPVHAFAMHGEPH